jgi:cytochrome c biogenesis protein CcmG/thiol:disulfide interchange protein DsbE
MTRWLRLGLPLLIFLLLAAVLARGLQFDPRKLPSVRQGRPAPSFDVPTLASAQHFSPQSMQGKVWVINVFASWCTACVVEHPRLLELARNPQVTLIGLAYKDQPEATAQWLKDHGDPYRLVALDLDGRVGIDYGVYGVPETYVVDAQGVIAYRHVGPIDAGFFEQHIAPLLGSTPAARTERS